MVLDWVSLNTTTSLVHFEYYRMLFKIVPGGALRSNALEWYDFKLEKIIGI